jgi:hypothetical protein
MGLPKESIVGHDTLREWGVGPFDVNLVMAEYYVLERLVADGSRKAKYALSEHEKRYSPMLLNYLSMICGGELRHASRILGYGSVGCEGWNCSGEESRYCDCCGEGPGYHDQPDKCRDCGLEKHEHKETEHEWGVPMPCGNSPSDFVSGYDPCGCYCPASICSECENAAGADDSWADNVDERVAEWITENSGGGRNGAWGEWLAFHKSYGPQALVGAHQVFDREWDGGGYGGSAWASIARVARDYALGKMSARIFMDRFWTLQHNGGNVFDKLYGSTDRSNLMQALEHQAHDNYTFLNRWTTQQTRSLWAQRDFHRFDMFDRDPVWLGRELPDRLEW